ALQLTVDLLVRGIPQEADGATELRDEVVAAERLAHQHGQDRVLQAHGTPLLTTTWRLCTYVHKASLITPADPTSEQRRTTMDARRTTRIERTVLALLALFAPVSPVCAAHLLVAGRQGIFRSADRHDASAVVRIAGEHELDRVPQPLCPSVTTLTFALAHEGSLALEDHGAVTLPCASWHVTASGYRYHDPDSTAGGVREIVLDRRRLVI